MIYFVIFGIFFELIFIICGIYLILKFINKFSDKIITPKTEHSSDKIIISKMVHDGVKDALQEILYEKEQKEMFEKKMRNPESIYSTIQQDEPVISDGDLIPYNITTKEKDILTMFYND